MSDHRAAQEWARGREAAASGRKRAREWGKRGWWKREQRQGQRPKYVNVMLVSPSRGTGGQGLPAALRTGHMCMLPAPAQPGPGSQWALSKGTPEPLVMLMR